MNLVDLIKRIMCGRFIYFFLFMLTVFSWHYDLDIKFIFRGWRIGWDGVVE